MAVNNDTPSYVLQVADDSLDLLSRLVGFLFVNLCRHDAAVLSMPVVTDTFTVYQQTYNPYIASGGR